MDWRIRAAGGSDLDPLAELVACCLGDSWSRAALGESLLDPITRIRVADVDGGDLVGFVVARRMLELVEIDLLGVAPASRRRGIAQALIGDLIDSERRDGANELRLELREANHAALALYAALGFVVVGRRSRYYPDGENALLLTRTLST